jgi:FkbM family methyltransferase
LIKYFDLKCESFYGIDALTSSNQQPASQSFAQHREDEIVWEYFDRKSNGFFMEVGANHPTRLSQTWLLEQRGWKGILVEPLPSCCEKLREVRKNSIVWQVAVGAPEQVGKATFNVADADAWSHMSTTHGEVSGTKQIEVEVSTLDRIIAKSPPNQIDFLSIDTEGMELQVLSGLDLKKHRPTLVVLEDHMDDLDLFFYMRRQGYTLCKRTGPNNWWLAPGAKPMPMPFRERLSLWNRIWFRKPRRRILWLLGRKAAN